MSVFAKAWDLNTLNNHSLPALEKSFGLKFVAIGENSLTAEVVVQAEMLQPFGILHGGVSCLIGESLGSIAGNMCLADENKVVVGQNLYAQHIRSARQGDPLKATATALHVGRRSQTWETLIESQGKTIAKITLTLAVIDKPSRS